MLSSTFHKFVDPIRDALRRFAELRYGPVGGVTLGHVGGPGVVDQALGQRARQHEFPFGHRDEGVAQPVEPEPGSTRFGDVAVEPHKVHDMIRPASGGWKHPTFPLRGRAVAVRQTLLEDAGELPSDRQLKRLPGLGFLDPEGERRSRSTRSQRSERISPRRIPV